MARRNGIMSSRLKEEIAKELGFYDVVQREGWGGIRARDAGNMVKRAIEMAEQSLAQQANQNSINK
ncbi:MULTISPECIES: small, acid-soluble spore protein, alpha/beta type [Ureibacillus]|jgi:small acid-soluble spore protein F (minor alpha/beta-type SASP)|uniref:Small acid-soluble spore protein F (Minor alpha/beta-type SASP) n=1 Tax=Ureibacillus thermosphaericus TaxID=51173 RepID=A0A840PSQ1_URETH|nr:small, acid-soluble spore protein, alpha/beta type [Ureibacillus thermosphaericus]MBB5149499.1 small acid-soluble spore protein F (minor alpha/beta-type SASP) [Ureibacillus thermosphaericus]NKZ32348.1 small, acid-soluble spore protein, alpha/beta type [Ureibacillus thermosphaericus]